jgi:hypothetical protein
MTQEPPVSASGTGKNDLGAIVAREWPYILVLALALIGVAYSSLTRTPITLYWIVLAPLVGVICVVTRWRAAASREARIRLIWMQALHWLAVLAAIQLMFVAVVGRMMNSDATALETLTLLALGTFTAGVHIASWRICLVGVLLALGVPAIAWLEESTLLIVLVAAVLVALAAPFVFREKRRPAGNL